MVIFHSYVSLPEGTGAQKKSISVVPCAPVVVGNDSVQFRLRFQALELTTGGTWVMMRTLRSSNMLCPWFSQWNAMFDYQIGRVPLVMSKISILIRVRRYDEPCARASSSKHPWTSIKYPLGSVHIHCYYRISMKYLWNIRDIQYPRNIREISMKISIDIPWISSQHIPPAKTQEFHTDLWHLGPTPTEISASPGPKWSAPVVPLLLWILPLFRSPLKEWEYEMSPEFLEASLKNHV